MTRIELTKDEANMLREILQNHLTELTHELAFSHSKDSIQYLKQRKEFIEGLIQRLGKEQAPGK